jgi:hypothetical protein
MERRLRRLEERFGPVRPTERVEIVVSFVGPEKGVTSTLLLESGKQEGKALQRWPDNASRPPKQE